LASPQGVLLDEQLVPLSVLAYVSPPTRPLVTAVVERVCDMTVPPPVHIAQNDIRVHRIHDAPNRSAISGRQRRNMLPRHRPWQPAVSAPRNRATYEVVHATDYGRSLDARDGQIRRPYSMRSEPVRSAVGRLGHSLSGATRKQRRVRSVRLRADSCGRCGRPIGDNGEMPRIDDATITTVLDVYPLERAPAEIAHDQDSGGRLSGVQCGDDR
jgi:hypothetical protein